VLARLETDDAIDVLADLADHERDAILAVLPLSDRAVLEEGLAFPEDSAGRLMRRDFVAVPEYWTVGQTIDYLRATADLPDEFTDILIIDPRFRPVGSVPLSRILRSARRSPMRALRLEERRLIPASMDQAEVAFLFRQYELVSAPVVGADGKLLGIVTLDDVVDIIDEEAEDDLMKLGGVSETDVFASPLVTARRRLPWLLVNLTTAIAASSVIASFEGAIEKVVELAVLMPIVASMGGNAGTQTLTVAVRSLAVKELSPANAWRVVRKELLVGGMNGLAFLAVGAALASFWSGSLPIAAIFGAAMLVNLVVAALAGILIPLAVDRLGLDPAVSSGVFLTTVTDCTGFFAFLGLAVYFLF
jgi:magnesium transporter